MCIGLCVCILRAEYFKQRIQWIIKWYPAVNERVCAHKSTYVCMKGMVPYSVCVCVVGVCVCFWSEHNYFVNLYASLLEVSIDLNCMCAYLCGCKQQQSTVAGFLKGIME